MTVDDVSAIRDALTAHQLYLARRRLIEACTDQTPPGYWNADDPEDGDDLAEEAARRFPIGPPT